MVGGGGGALAYQLQNSRYDKEIRCKSICKSCTYSCTLMFPYTLRVLLALCRRGGKNDAEEPRETIAGRGVNFK